MDAGMRMDGRAGAYPELVDAVSLEGVGLRGLRSFTDERGTVRHFLKQGDPEFGDGVGEVYFSTVVPMVFKGWHLHTRMTLRYVCVLGEADVFLLDERNPARRLFAKVRLGPSEYRLLTIPPGISNAFMSAPVVVNTDQPGVVYYGGTDAMIANAASIPHDPDEIVRRQPLATDFPQGFQPFWSLAG